MNCKICGALVPRTTEYQCDFCEGYACKKHLKKWKSYCNSGWLGDNYKICTDCKKNDHPFLRYWGIGKN